ncbi:uncharacterized protein LOC142321353 [Lycorma delicatula]|uniref:uncharacterized protein LOC142321353 n=1 Tax=Lycorma delicatula TaxID=130591 RepID=UPI003F5130D7
MSTTGRTTQRGGKNLKTETNTAVKTQKPEVKMDSTKSLPTAEQMRIAQIIGTKNEDPSLKNKIKQVMDATRKSEDEVCTALHDCDNDANRAVNYLLEGDERQNEWLTSGKKKKNRTASASKTDAQMNNHVSSGGEGEDWDSPQGGDVGGGTGRGRGGGGQDRERPRQRGGGPPRMRGRGSLENRGWRGRENKENERNLEEGGYGGGGRRERGGRMSNGPLRSGRGGRGRIGARTFQNKDKNSNQKFSCTIETWNNPSSEDPGEKVDFPSPEDWDNEEYTGSLADSKVFTPSTGTEQPPVEEAEVTHPSGHITDTQEQAHTQPPQLSSSPVGVNTLTPAQSQYLSQFTHQGSADNFKNALNGVSSSSQATSTQAYPTVFTPTSVSCTSNFGATVNIYTSSHQELNSVQSQTNTARSKPQRPRVPPPSKIPSSAVEMPPGDAVNSGIGFLDVQFGGLEFGSSDTTLDNSVESSTSTPASTTTPAPVPPPTVSTPAVSAMDAYVTSSPQQTSIASALNQSQKLSSGESLIQSEPVVSSSYGTSSVRSGTVVSGTSTSLSELTSVSSKTADASSLSYGTASEPTSIYQTPSAYQKTSAPAYQTPVSTYNSSSYSTTQVTSSTNVYNSSQVGGYASAGSGGYTTSVNSAATTPSVNAYPNTNSYSGAHQTTGASYPYATYPTAGSTGGYQSAGQAYPPQSAVSAVYGTTYPYHNSYNSTNPPVVSTQQSHKISGATLSSNSSKDSQYEAVPASNSMTVAVSSIAPVTTASATPSLGLSGSSQMAGAAASSTKVASIPAVSKSGVVPNIPAGVPPILGTQYIMSQTGGLQYYQQPVFSYEDAAIQVIQQRLPPHVVNPGYFDIGFQPPTSLATGRDGLASVAYSVPDVRFTRSDNNTSPVPSTLSQQSATQAAHQQPIINPAIPAAAAYAYFYSGFPAGNFQYGPPMYTPVAPTATASGHGNSTSAQYAKGPGGYSSGGYGSGYETGSAADYTAVKVGTGGTGYTASPAQNKTGTSVGTPTGTNPSTTSDLMYNKSHGTLGKVNSYEKQGFHSGTPPPFNMTGSQNTGIAPTSVYPPQLIFSGMPHQQHHSTTMMHQQPMHQIEMRNQGRRTDGGTGSGARSQTSTQQNKSGAKQNYSPSYWNAN